MSRIGKAPIALPSGVKVEMADQTVQVTGPKGVLSLQVNPQVSVRIDDGKLWVERSSEAHRVKALHGLTRSLLNNLVQGVTEGFQRQLEINGVGYRASLQGRTLVLNLGYSHPIHFEPPEGIEIQLPQRNIIAVSGIDKQVVGQVAAKIRNFRPPDPYKGKGIKYATEKLRLKEGKGKV
ncbi:MAG: 50S ribosomal protein L6 [Candidatus Tectomicrobia bacterium]|uniref:Large ribosomal subunit protein uL6 n=1 Tax=Tectimicrobiota bacterium TaxID=2528274 RepID=A0A932CQQ7_UNCTE|nr:50S ribosomal protein L6 [Candidatus Tectomicrobia bacterium]